MPAFWEHPACKKTTHAWLHQAPHQTGKRGGGDHSSSHHEPHQVAAPFSSQELQLQDVQNRSFIVRTRKRTSQTNVPARGGKNSPTTEDWGKIKCLHVCWLIWTNLTLGIIWSILKTKARGKN